MNPSSDDYGEVKPYNTIIMSASAYQNKCLFWSIWTYLEQMVGRDNLSRRGFGFKSYLELFSEFLPEKVWNLDGTPSYEMVSLLGGTHYSANDLEKGFFHQGNRTVYIDGLAESEEGRAVLFCLELTRLLGLRFEFWSVEKMGSSDDEKRMARLTKEPIKIGTGLNCVRIALYRDHFYLIIDRWGNEYRSKEYLRELSKSALELEQEWFSDRYPKLYAQYNAYVQEHNVITNPNPMKSKEKHKASNQSDCDAILAAQLARVFMS